MKKGDALDPKGLIHEAYNIDGISAGECRSIFLDWALSHPGDPKAAIAALLDRFGAQADHPMTETLRAGLGAPEAPRRRGGRRGRVPDAGLS